MGPFKRTLLRSQAVVSVFVSTLLSLALGCESIPEGQSAVSLSFGGVSKAALNAEVEPRRAYLRVRAADIRPDIIVDLPLNGGEVDILVPSGPGRFFEVLVVGDVRLSGEVDTDAAGDGLLTNEFELNPAQEKAIARLGGRPLYWGGRVLDLAPRSTLEFSMTAYRAGLAAGRVELADGEPLPRSFVMKMEGNEQASRDDLPGSVPVPVFEDGGFDVFLPTGGYRVDAALADEGLSMPFDVKFDIAQGQVLAPLVVLLAGEEFCNPNNPVDLDGDGIDCLADSDDANPNCGEDDTDRDGDRFCADFDCDDDPDTGGAGCNRECPTYFVDVDGDGHTEAPDDSIQACANPDPENLTFFPTDCFPGEEDPEDVNAFLEWFRDRDGDGFVSNVNPYVGCNPPTNAVPKFAAEPPFDCDDFNMSCGADCYPGAPEIQGDGYDNNCDGEEDEAVTTINCWPDQDGDGEGDTNADPEPTDEGQCPEETVPNDFDCNDEDDKINSQAVDGIADGIDGNCDGRERCYRDDDQDGYGSHLTRKSAPGDFGCTGADGVRVSNVGTDCDDQNADFNWDDADGDGNPSCLGDCDDTDAGVSDHAFENCLNGIDDDCDGNADLADNDCQGPDEDADGYPANIDCEDSAGSGGAYTLEDLDGDGWSSCGRLEDVYGGSGVPSEWDCDDTARDANPNRFEKCGDSVDNDCNGTPDDFCADLNCLDDDNDGYVIDGGGCSAPAMYLDCDDSDPALNWDDNDGDGGSTCGGPDGPDPDDSDWLFSAQINFELCRDGNDNDGDFLVDGADPDCDTDLDNDGFGDGLDCDDNVGFVYVPHPGPQGGYMTPCVFDCRPLYPDADGDGYGDDSAASIFTCPGPMTAKIPTDCDDTDGLVGPFAQEICGNTVDEDCSGNLDDLDLDYDGFVAVMDGGGNNCGGTDCNDDPFGGEFEIPFDFDGDGTDTCNGDCDDFDPMVGPHMAGMDTCEIGGFARDDDCDGSFDEDQDQDGDGVGDCNDNCITTPNPVETPTAWTLEWYGADCGGFDGTDYEITLNGTVIGDLTGQVCTADGVIPSAEDITAAAAGEWSGRGDDYIQLHYIGPGGNGDGNIKWARVSVTYADSSLDYYQCLYDGPFLEGSPCDDPATSHSSSFDCSGTCPQHLSTPMPGDQQLWSMKAGFSGSGVACEDDSTDPTSCSSGPMAYPAIEIDGDGFDNDCDGLIDSGDPYALDATGCSTDDDYDGYPASAGCNLPDHFTDCDDNMSTGTNSSPGLGEGSFFDCTDGDDNDCDGEPDTDDKACRGKIFSTATAAPAGAATQWRPYELGTLVPLTPHEANSTGATTCDISFGQSLSGWGSCGVYGAVTGQAIWVTFSTQALDIDGTRHGEAVKICNPGSQEMIPVLADFDAGAAGILDSPTTNATCLPPQGGSGILPGECWDVTSVLPTTGGVVDDGDHSFVFVTRGDFGGSCGDNLAVDIRFEADDCFLRDDDGDGDNACIDCDDHNSDINQWATERCDFQDNNCDGQVDEGVKATSMIAFYDFDSGLTGWTENVNLGSTTWANPTSSVVGPGGAASFGNAVLGTDGNQTGGGSAENEDSEITSPVVDISGYTDGDEVLGVSFQSWTYNQTSQNCDGAVDEERFDYTTTEIGSWRGPFGPGCNPLNSWEYDGQWRAVGVPLGEVMPGHSNLELRFGYRTGDALSLQDDGWYIDNLEVYTCEMGGP